MITLDETVSTLRKLFRLYQCSASVVVTDDNASLSVVVTDVDDDALVSELCAITQLRYETRIVVVPACPMRREVFSDF